MRGVEVGEDLVDDQVYRRLRERKATPRTAAGDGAARVAITTAPGEEAQVDYGEGPMLRNRETGKYRRTRLFVFTLGYLA